MLPDEKIIEIIQKHYPCFDVDDDAVPMLALEREIEAEAVKAVLEWERKRIANELSKHCVKWTDIEDFIDQLREGK